MRIQPVRGWHFNFYESHLWKLKVKLRERKAVWLCNWATGWYILYEEQWCKHVMIHNPKACKTASVWVLMKNRRRFCVWLYLSVWEFERLSLLLSRQVHPDGVWRPPGPVSVRGERGRDMVSQQEAGRRPGAANNPDAPRTPPPYHVVKDKQRELAGRGGTDTWNRQSLQHTG